jgi:galactokinase/mevalonate kinase-like predicted kinase
MAGCFAKETGLSTPHWFAGHDPVGEKLGSGGGTAHLIREAWRQCQPTPWSDWCAQEKRLILHAGGQSRRLPAYAASGKSLLPIPVFRWSRGQRIDQTLLDLQLELPSKLLDSAPETLRWLIASGDVLIRSEEDLPRIPDADVVCLGLWAHPEQAAKHGVFFLSRQNPEALDFVLQKPLVSRIHQLVETHFFLLDIGLWLLSDRAIEILLRRCHCSTDPHADPATPLTPLDLYGTFGPALGAHPSTPDPEISTLTTAILPLPGGEFFHFGTNSELISSCLTLQNSTLDQRRIFGGWVKPHPSIFVQNAHTAISFQPDHQNIWIENSHLSSGWQLQRDHILTGIPPNDWAVSLSPGQCLDIAPVLPTAEQCIALRPYGLDDAFRGPLKNTLWLQQPFTDWLERHHLTFPALGLSPDTDLQAAAIFPVCSADSNAPHLLNWMLANDPPADHPGRQLYLAARRLSADDLSTQADLPRLFAQRRSFLRASLPALARHAARSVFYQVDLRHLASEYASAGLDLPPNLPTSLSEGVAGLGPVHDRMFRAAVLAARGENPLPLEQEAFALLRQAVLARVPPLTAPPRNSLLPDQILWGRSPLRLDLAGGWSDTPPYCFLEGGHVVNVAVELNGQPPVQVFSRVTQEPTLKIRSIDLGLSQVLQTYEEVASYAEIGSGFAIAKAAFALAGFHPDFCPGAPYLTLREQLRQFGGGIEISLLAAVPKGSGLGTSSILAATILGVLNDLCGLGWNLHEVAQRTLALEQMLTSGGGWQDQYGGLLPGLKLLQTRPGLEQIPHVRWLPDALFTHPDHRGNLLLYYTGITRTARDLLGNIVRGMFLNSRPELPILENISRHAHSAAEALESQSWDAFGQSLARSWQLNQALDAGTNPPELARILPLLAPHLAGLKLLGAGGGGYLLLAARNAAAAGHLREILRQHPTGPGARRVDFAVSTTGFQVSRS